MVVATVVLSVLLAGLLVLSARAKLTHDTKVMATMRTVGASDRMVRTLASLEIAGAVGLLVGIAVAWIGVLAAVAITTYFLGAVLAHLRVGDRDVVPAVAPLVLAVLVLLLRATGT